MKFTMLGAIAGLALCAGCAQTPDKKDEAAAPQAKYRTGSNIPTSHDAPTASGNSPNGPIVLPPKAGGTVSAGQVAN